MSPTATPVRTATPARTASCIYEGAIRHRRTEPRREFRHRLALFYLDLDELPSLLDGRLTAARPGLLRFRRRDYLGPATRPLDHAVRDAVETHTGARPAGPVRVLTQLRSFGHYFNPVSFYYCLDGAGEQVEAVVAEVTNTPWGERHAYVLPGGWGSFDKALHVSPFMGMDHRYTARACAAGRAPDRPHREPPRRRAQVRCHAGTPPPRAHTGARRRGSPRATRSRMSECWR